MQIQYTKNLNPGRFELGTTLIYRLFCRETWFKNNHFSDDDRDKPDTTFLLWGNGLLGNGLLP